MFEILLVIISGLVFGSFITCASYRLPLEIDVIRKPSFCPSCLNNLGVKDLFPLFSWLFSGGKCRHCQSKIHFRYPLIEVLTSTIFVALYTNYGFSAQGLILVGMAVMLLIMIVADLEHYIIPDVVHILLLPLGIAYRFATDSFSPDILWGFGVMTALALFLHYGYSALRGRAMLGFGDVKFFAVAGVWMDAGFIPAFLLIAGVLGVVFGIIWKKLGKGEAFPFGPALAVSLFLCVLFPELNLLHK